MVSRGFLTRALAWIDESLAHFQPHNCSGLDETPLAELSVLCMCLHRNSPRRWRRWLKSFLDFIVPIYTSPLFRERFARTGLPFASRVQMFNALVSCGARLPMSERTTIQQLLTQGNVTHRGIPPHRRLEMRYVLDLGAFRHNLPSYSALYNQTILSEPQLNLIYLTDSETYAITHILFYLSDLGRQPIVFPAHGVHRRVEDIVRQLLGIYIRAGNWDLVGELLLSLHCLGSISSPWYKLGWQCIKSAQLQSGAVPGPHFDKTDMTNGGPKHQNFWQCYHTTIVACIAGVTCSKPL
jgi:hypothetical protein